MGKCERIEDEKNEWETKRKGVFREKRASRIKKRPDPSRPVGPPGGVARGGAAETGRGIRETTPQGQAL